MYPKAVAKIVDHMDELLYKYPAEHWVHLRTTSPMNLLSRRCDSGRRSPRAPVHVRLNLPWPTIRSTPIRLADVQSNAPHLVAVVRAVAVFHKGKLLRRPTDIASTPYRSSPRTPDRRRLKLANPQVLRISTMFRLDEFGPLNLQPHPGLALGAARRQAQIPTVSRPAQSRNVQPAAWVRHLFAAYDLASEVYGPRQADQYEDEFSRVLPLLS